MSLKFNTLTDEVWINDVFYEGLNLASSKNKFENASFLIERVWELEYNTIDAESGKLYSR